MAEPSPTARPPGSPLRWVAALLVAPQLLVGPIHAAGQVFLPFLPVVHEPLASENPAAAEVARREIHPTMGDRVYPFLVDQRAARAELLAGNLPTWEPLQTLGMPLFGGNIAALGYPPNWLAFLLPPERAAAPLALLALFLAGLGTWLFLRRLELDPRAALVGALGAELGGFGLANLHYYMKVDAALWLPWALWAVEGLARRARWSRTALVLALSLSFLGGMVSISVFVLAATGLYALARLGPWGRERAPAVRRLAQAALLGTLGVAGAAYWILPVGEAGRASLRGGQTPEVTLANSLPPTTSLGILVPELAGPSDDPTPNGSLPLAWWLTPASMAARAEGANVLEWDAYALVALVLLALAGVAGDPRRAAFPALLLVLCFGFAQGWPLVRLLYHVPGFDLGAPQRVLALAWILWPWLAALGLEALLARRPRALATLLATACVAALGLFQAWSALEPALWAAELVPTLQARHPGTPAEVIEARLPLAERLAAGEHLCASYARAASAALAVLLAGAACLLLDRRAPRFGRGPRPAALVAGLVAPLAAGALPFAIVPDFGTRGPQALLGLSAVVALAAAGARGARAELGVWLPLAAVLVLEGFLGSARDVRGRSVLTDGLFPPSPTLELVRAAAGDGRVLRLDPTPDFAESQRLARPNLLVPYGIADLTPYPTFTPREAAELASRIDPRMVRLNHVAPLPELALVGHPLLDLLRAQCVLSVRPLVHPRLEPVAERDGFCVYRRAGALPAARIVPRALAGASDDEVLAALAARDVDFAAATRVAPEHAGVLPDFAPGPEWTPGTIAALERPAKDRVRVRVRDSRGGFLVLHEQWARGWSARVNGSPAPLVRADHYARAVPIPAGDVEVEFAYSPPALRWGVALSILALLGVVVYELLNRE
jgi:hypothetical protein